MAKRGAGRLPAPVVTVTPLLMGNFPGPFFGFGFFFSAAADRSYQLPHSVPQTGQISPVNLQPHTGQV